jgi:hypothetical protein
MDFKGRYEGRYGNTHVMFYISHVWPLNKTFEKGWTLYLRVESLVQVRADMGFRRSDMDFRRADMDYSNVCLVDFISAWMGSISHQAFSPYRSPIWTKHVIWVYI